MNVTSIKKFSNLQTNYMFLGYIAAVPNVFTDVTNFTITLREMAVLEVSRDKTDFRFLNRQISLPQGTKNEGEFTCTMVLDEQSSFYKDYTKWFYKVESFKLNGEDFKSNLVIQLLNLDGSVSNSCFAMLGIYPLNIPEIGGLNAENTEGHITFEAKFAVDAIAHGTVTNGAIVWAESDPSVVFPYKDKLVNLGLITSA